MQVSGVDSDDTIDDVDRVNAALLSVGIATTIHRAVPVEARAGRSQHDARIDLAAAVYKRFLQRFRTIDIRRHAKVRGAGATHQHRAEGDEKHQ